MRLSPWLRQPLPCREGLEFSAQLKTAGVDTICSQAHCPNASACFKHKCATFLILGPVCTRGCRFCAVEKKPATPLPQDPQEPERIARAVSELGLAYAVVTSVTRDDLADRGAGQFASTVRAIRRRNPGIGVEVLIPDFQGEERLLRLVAGAHPSVIGHNLETVARLYPAVRTQADYRVSLDVLRMVKETAPGVAAKSSLMLGLSETEAEVEEAMRDLRRVRCDILCLGQYLAPSPRHQPVHEFVSPQRFEEYRRTALALGFSAVSAGPLVRSSYNAQQTFEEARVCLT